MFLPSAFSFTHFALNRSAIGAGLHYDESLINLTKAPKSTINPNHERLRKTLGRIKVRKKAIPGKRMEANVLAYH